MESSTTRIVSSSIRLEKYSYKEKPTKDPEKKPASSLPILIRFHLLLLDLFTDLTLLIRPWLHLIIYPFYFEFCPVFSRILLGQQNNHQTASTYPFRFFRESLVDCYWQPWILLNFTWILDKPCRPLTNPAKDEKPGNSLPQPCKKVFLLLLLIMRIKERAENFKGIGRVLLLMYTYRLIPAFHLEFIH